MALSEAQEVVEFWFGHGDPMAQSARWWKKDPEFDKEIHTKFSALITKAKEGQLNHWHQEPQSVLGFVILLDQFSRNAFRDTAEAFAQDPLALKTVLDAIERGLDKKMNAIERWFFYMPMMHSEDKDIQKLSLETYTQLIEDAPEEHKKSAQGAYNFAVKHADIVFKYGRYPHRNDILGRDSTAEEQEFLKGPGSSF